MSIVTLKKKSRRFQVPISGLGNNGFSLNGGTRNYGRVGQTNFGRSVTGTPFRGTEPRGHGGSNGNYVVKISAPGELCIANDASIIKKTVKNNLGHIYSTIKYPTAVSNASCQDLSCQPIWTKGFLPDNYSQSTYINDLVNLTLAINKGPTDPTSSCYNSATTPWAPPNAGFHPCLPDCEAASYHIGGKLYTLANYGKDLGLLNSQSDYMRGGLMAKNCLPTPANKQPFPMMLNKNGCDVNALTPAQAKANGLLPPDWIG
jgi:hypothetical protein